MRIETMGMRWRYRIQAVADGSFVGVSVLVAAIARHEFALGDVSWSRTFSLAAIAAVIQVAVGMLTGLYAGAHRFGSFDEVFGVSRAIAITTVAVASLNLAVLDRLVPLSVSLFFGFLALPICLGVRWLWRYRTERVRRPDPDRSAATLVFGAGEAGHQVITAMLRDPDSPYLPVGILDDDIRKVHLKISGVPVVGRRDHVVDAARRTGATALVVAIPSAGNKLIREVARAATDAGLKVMVLPPTGELLDGRVGLGDIRPLTEEDLLGRNRVDTDIESIADYVTGRRVLVTGAGGSIGSELCRQLYRFGPDALIMLDRDESGLHATQLSIDGRGQLDTRALVVADIRDHERLMEVWAEWKPDVVFHAAALKHVPLLEMHPEEAHKTNVVGTANVLAACAAHGAERVVNVSTDKAADPVNVLGRTKREAELLTARQAALSPGTYVSVRFGNVLGSRGSVLVAFRKQIEDGGPVTVTHPDVTRYFMTVAEAVQLVIQAGAIGADGEVLILQMGEPVKIADVARQLVDAAGGDIEIEFTGLREGEKLHEILVGEGEEPVVREHPMIMHVAGLPADATTETPALSD